MAEITIGDNDYQAFADLDFADEYLGADVLRATAWATKNDDARGRGLVSATRLLQRQAWIDGVPSLDDPPDVVKEATALLAADILTKPKMGDSASTASSVRRVKAGSAEVELFRSDESTPLPTAVWQMLTAAGLLGGSDSGGAGAIVSGTRDRSHFPQPGQDVVPWRDTGWPEVDCG